jgi:multicomponent K+:H+ antiporter subunit G
MIDAGALPPVVAALVALFALLGAAFALIGSFGLLRLRTFYQRVHPPTMGTTIGVGFTLASSMLLFSVLRSRPVLHEIVIAVFVIVTTPVTYMLLVRAAVHRDQAAGRDGPDAELCETDDASTRASARSQGVGVEINSPADRHPIKHRPTH